MINQSSKMFLGALFSFLSFSSYYQPIEAFTSPSTTPFSKNYKPLSSLYSTATNEPYTIQILMSDTGGGHRASANALRDAFDVLYGEGKIEVDIVDLYTDYGPFWPFNWYVPAYKIMAEYSFLWKAFYEFGATDFGLWLNEAVLEVCMSTFLVSDSIISFLLCFIGSQFLRSFTLSQ